MKAFHISSTAMLTGLLCSQTHAGALLPKDALVPRQAQQGAQIVNEIIKIFGEIFKGAKMAFPDIVNAWDYGANGNMCEIYMETTNGVDCYASVTCNDGKREYNGDKATWNVCFQGGRQYFNDPRIGDFSITFKDKNGLDGEGLTGPVLQVKEIGNWMEIPATTLASQKKDNYNCEAHNGLKCKSGPYICTWLEYEQYKGRTRQWKCGVPKRGMNFPGLDSDKPTNDRGYAPGWCGAHITQYQKPDPSRDQYSLEAKIFDANQNEIGNSGGKHGGNKLVFDTKLRLPFVINARAVDADPLDFEYDNVRWDSNEQAQHHCNVGAYDNGKREMDCGFSCK